MPSAFSLLSPATIAIIATAALLLTVLRGTARIAAFIALNLVFLLFCVLGLSGTLTTLAFAGLGYLLIRFLRNAPTGAYVAGVAAFVLLFIYMKRYTFLEALLPGTALTSVLSTVGLSFLFFKILHVLIDARSGTLGPLDPATYLAYCTNFTTFVMGPIQRYQDHRTQWNDVETAPDLETYLDAIIRILVGFVKAYVLAEWAKPFTIALTQDPTARTTGELVIGIYAFNLYLYLNFAGYCDVVIGAGTLFGLRPPENFDKPFLARNISEFWQRQHRSLSLWLTDYVFTPTFKSLLETRRFAAHPLVAVSLSLMITMTVSGLWHGTSLGFLLFGLTHGAYLVVHRTWDAILNKQFGRKSVRVWRSRWWVQAAGIVVTFNAVSFSFVFFLLDAGTALRVLGQVIWP